MDRLEARTVRIGLRIREVEQARHAVRRRRYGDHEKHEQAREDATHLAGRQAGDPQHADDQGEQDERRAEVVLADDEQGHGAGDRHHRREDVARRAEVLLPACVEVGDPQDKRELGEF